MAKGLKYLLLMLLLILGCDDSSSKGDGDSGFCIIFCGDEPEGEVITETSLCGELTEVELWGEYYDIATTDSLHLYNQGLTGSIPPEIGCLTNLDHLSLYNNQLTGEIPSEIGNLTNLTYLWLYNNQLTGSIPSTIGNLTNLTWLNLHTNQLTGEIPQAVCDLMESNNLYMYNILTGNNITNTCEETTDVCVDIDGNVYETIQIGEQLWMAENLKVTHYNNGDEIAYPSNEDFGSLGGGQYGVYDNDPSNADIYGNLYNWAAIVDDRGVCPDGWHVPSDGEFMELEMELGMSELLANSTGYRGTDEGSKLAGSSDLWNDGDLDNNSEFGTSGFNVLPAGYRNGSNGFYFSMGNFGYFWSSSEDDSSYAWYRVLSYNYSSVYRNFNYKPYGFSVRCLGD